MSFTRNLQNYLKQSQNHNKCETFKTSSSWFEETGWTNSIDDYQLIEQIGSGSFGLVFRAQPKNNNNNTNRQCAIKCIAKLKSPNIGKILSEVSIHIRLVHRNILQLFTVLEDPKNVYLVMEICYGGSLAQLIGQEVGRRKTITSTSISTNPDQSDALRPVLPYDIILIIVRQICDSLSYLHRHSIIHRDLNLNNILLVNKLELPTNQTSIQKSKSPLQYYQSCIQIKVADFGLAIDLNSITKPPPVMSKSLESRNHLRSTLAINNNNPIGTTICGTPGYISPEIWTQMRTVSYKSDIFSLGSIVFACIAGYTPKGDIDLSSFLPMTADLITRLLNQNPDDRPEISEILQHIFIAGRLSTKRLFPIEKLTKNLRMSIDQLGNVEFCFLKKSSNNLTISLSDDGELVSVGCPLLPEGQQIDAIQKFNFYELPEQYWKKFMYLVRFVRLVQAKTPKITVHCSIEDSSESSRITRCTLMENGNFEVTLHRELLNENIKFIYVSQEQDENLPPPSNLTRFIKTKLDELYAKVLKIERTFLQIFTELKLDLFPASFGKNIRLEGESPQRRRYNSESSRRLSSSPLKSDDSEGSFISSQILKSMQISGIGHATQFSNGSLKVNFNDGSDLCLDNESQIFYIEDGVLKRFNKEDILPEIVLNKIARLPQVIDHLRQSSKHD